MRIATNLLLATGALFVAGCSLIIDAELDEKGITSGSGGQGGGGGASSIAASTSSSTSAGDATSTTGAAQSSSASSGGCGSDCVLANATSNCVNGICAISVCNSQFDDCDMVPENGCEANLNSDIAHCGSCGHTCKTTQKCAGSKCK